MFHFQNTCLNSFNISSLLSGGIIISSTCFGFTILSVILFPINLPGASAALWITFLKAVFKASIPVFVAVSVYCFPYLLDE